MFASLPAWMTPSDPYNALVRPAATASGTAITTDAAAAKISAAFGGQLQTTSLMC